MLSLPDHGEPALDRPILRSGRWPAPGSDHEVLLLEPMAEKNGLKPGDNYKFFPFPKIKDGVPNAALGPVDGMVTAINAKHPENARKLLSFLISDTNVQAQWATVQGALSANINVPLSTYNSVMTHALDVVKAADTFAFNYDLASPPPVAEVGLNMFQKFVNDQSNIDGLLSETQKAAADAFKS